jgi:RNA polymerase sigma-70 factor (ECF subfamily)
LQEAWLRWQATDPAAIQSEKAWLSTVVTRLCLDKLKSARVQREQYVGPCLPEPIRTEERVDPDSISMAFLVLLEQLNPVERAAYLLHEVFNYSHSEVAAMLDKEEATCRQIYHRARGRIRDGRPRFSPSRAEHERLLRTFASAMMNGDLSALEQARPSLALVRRQPLGQCPAHRGVRRPIDLRAAAVQHANLGRRRH